MYFPGETEEKRNDPFASEAVVRIAFDSASSSVTRAAVTAARSVSVRVPETLPEESTGAGWPGASGIWLESNGCCAVRLHAVAQHRTGNIFLRLANKTHWRSLCKRKRGTRNGSALFEVLEAA